MLALIFTVLLQLPAQAQFVPFGNNSSIMRLSHTLINCKPTQEQFGLLKGRKICVMSVRCESHPNWNARLRGPNFDDIYYCQLNPQGKCLSAASCKADSTIKQSDLEQIKRLPLVKKTYPKKSSK